MPFPLIPVIGAAAGLIGQGVNALSTSSANRRAEQFQRQMYDRQRADALADWNRNNEYNSPLAQMTRFKEAGLNPNLIYGQGTQAAPIRSSSVGNFKPDAPQFDLAGVLREFMALQMEQAQISNQEKLLELREKELEAKGYKNEMLGIDAAYKPDMAKYSLESLRETIRNREMQTVTGYNRDNREWTKIKLLEEMAPLQRQEIQARIKSIGQAILGSQQSIEESKARIIKIAKDMEMTDTQIKIAYLAGMNLIRDGKIKDFEVKMVEAGVKSTWVEKFMQTVLGSLQGIAERRIGGPSTIIQKR